MTLRKLCLREVKKIRSMTAELFVVRQGNIRGGFGKCEAHWKIPFKLLSICIGLMVSKVTIKPWNGLAGSTALTEDHLDRALLV